MFQKDGENGKKHAFLIFRNIFSPDFCKYTIKSFEYIKPNLTNYIVNASCDFCKLKVDLNLNEKFVSLAKDYKYEVQITNKIYNNPSDLLLQVIIFCNNYIYTPC